jgi:hypothetical protein
MSLGACQESPEASGALTGLRSRDTLKIFYFFSPLKVCIHLLLKLRMVKFVKIHHLDPSFMEQRAVLDSRCGMFSQRPPVIHKKPTSCSMRFAEIVSKL